MSKTDATAEETAEATTEDAPTEEPVVDADVVDDPEGDRNDPAAEEEGKDDAPEEQPGQPSQAIARRPDRTPLIQRDPVAIAKAFAASGYFKDTLAVPQAVVKIVAGEELGFGPMTAMNGIHIIEGKPSLSANLLGTLVKRHPHYDFRVAEVTAEKAVLRFLERGVEIGRSEFTIEQAKRAGLVRSKSGWEKYPEAMLFARALSQGVRWYCPEVTAGSPAYTPEELGADVDERGEVVEAEIVDEPAEQPAPPPMDPDRAKFLLDGIDRMGLTPMQVNIMLGSIGLDGLGDNTEAAVTDRVQAMSEEDGDKLEQALDNHATTDA